MTNSGPSTYSNPAAQARKPEARDGRLNYLNHHNALKRQKRNISQQDPPWSTTVLRLDLVAASQQQALQVVTVQDAIPVFV